MSIFINFEEEIEAESAPMMAACRCATKTSTAPSRSWS